MEIEIVSEMAEPTKRHTGGGRVPIYPFKDLKVGAGFKVAFNSSSKKDREKIERRVRTATMSWRRNHTDFAYLTYTVDERNTADELNAVKPAGPGICVKRIASMPLRKKTVKSSEAVATETPAELPN